MEAKHAPGPWHIESGGARLINTQALVISAADGLGPVAYSTGANARLIAAAPSLLAVAQELAESAAYWSEYDVPVGIVDRMNAAIARATA